MKDLKEKLDKHSRERLETDNERKSLLEKMIELEQRSQELNRDLELRDIKIESLEGIIKKRE